MSWVGLWKVMFVAVMAIFAVMSCLVTVFGARDIKKLLRALGREKESSKHDEDAG